ncbi:uncharacterized protein LOC117640248 [Thrips palmi]|uniref:Uncharacterized protein LOC117640248 n=1 Tax=Thrips palmi TaxID=161013 RepID=A0A6P8Y795_THRPL|nr:uncharacterized protein LOC117640248 [Thrips palmi]
MTLVGGVLGQVLGLAVLGVALTGWPGGGPGPGALALPMADHVHVVHRGVVPAALPRQLQPLVFPRRRVHILDPRTALNLVQAHESRRRRGSKRPPPYYRGPPRGPPRPRWKGPPKRRGHGGPRDKPWAQATRGSSPAATRVRYRGSKKSKKSKTAKKSRPQLPTYADGYAEDDDLRLDDEPEPEEDRPRKKTKSTSKLQQQETGYPKGWGPDGGYRVPAPQYPPYGTDEEEPGTGHLDLEERFINQHNQFYRHGYPGDSSESAPASTQSKRHNKPGPGLAPGLYEDEEIELAENSDDFDGGLAASSHSTRQTSYRRPSKTRYSLHDGTLHDADDSSRESEYRRPSYSGKARKKPKQPGDSKRHQSMYHAKFRGEQQDDRTLSAANFNYELSGAASETATRHTSAGQGGHQGGHQGGNHRPAHDEQAVSDVRTADSNFFRTRKPQYWG